MTCNTSDCTPQHPHVPYHGLDFDCVSGIRRKTCLIAFAYCITHVCVPMFACLKYNRKLQILNSCNQNLAYGIYGFYRYYVPFQGIVIPGSLVLGRQQCFSKENQQIESAVA